MSGPLKITYMGQELPEEELPAAGATTLEDYFAPVILSPLAIDRASVLIPKEDWEKWGLHTWLTKAANIAFQRLPVKETEYKSKRCTYVFEYAAEGPVLKTIKI